MHTIKEDEAVAMTVDTLAELLERGEEITILDVRPANEREEWFIPGSIHVDAYDRLKRNEEEALSGIDLPEDRPIVTVCGAGRTSVVAADQLRRQGHRAWSLEGGMKAWSLAFNTADAVAASSASAIVQVRRAGKGCLSYLVGSGDEAAVIDASLPPEVYVRLARGRGWRITHVLDTHIHADHFSRGQALARLAGAALHLPAQERVSFPYDALQDRDVVAFGGARLQALRTPGHTRESTCFLLDGSTLFTGDTLFIDGVGRPDLNASVEEARLHAGEIYDSLQRLLREVPSTTLVLPGHTSSPAPFDGVLIGDTLGTVRGRVEVLARPRAEFVRYLLGRIPSTPPNFERIVSFNERGDEAPDDILDLEAGANRCAIS